MKTWFLRIGLPALACGIFSASASFASPIFITNFSFETLPGGGLPFTCGPSCAYSDDDIPGWTVVQGTTGQFQPGPPANTGYFNSVPDGITVGYTNHGSITQITSALVQLGVTYTLTVDFGFRKDLPNPGTAAILIDGVPVSFASGVSLGLVGDWSTFTATYVGILSDVGKTIGIQLASAAPEGVWDNVQLSADVAGTGVPEPTSLALAGAGLVGFAFSRRKRA